MEEFIADVLGRDIVITLGLSDDFCLTCFTKVVMATDKSYIIGENHFSLNLSESCIFTKTEEGWLVKTPKNLELLISKLDKIR